MTDNATRISIELEIDAIEDGKLSLEPGVLARSGESSQAVTIELAQAETGHGFGLSELVTIIISVGVGASSDLVADALRAAIGRVIRRAKGSSATSDGSRQGLTELIESERTAGCLEQMPNKESE
jgi:hypothetical protein